MQKHFKIKERHVPYLLVLPAFAAMAVTLFFPLVELFKYSTVIWSLGRPQEDMKFVGLDNFANILSPGSSFWHSLKLTLLYLVVSVVFQVLLGLVLASLFNKRFPGQGSLVSLLIIPTVLMPVMTAMMWRIYLYPNGIINYLLSLIGITGVDWYSSSMAMPAVILIQIWQWTPFYVISLLSGLRSIDTSLYEAAEMDGASSWQKYYHITLPLLKPVLGVCITIRAMNLIREFDNVFIIYGGGPGSSSEVLGLSIYRAMFGEQQVGMAAALSVILIIISCALCLLLIRSFGNNKQDA